MRYSNYLFSFKAMIVFSSGRSLEYLVMANRETDREIKAIQILKPHSMIQSSLPGAKVVVTSIKMNCIY